MALKTPELRSPNELKRYLKLQRAVWKAQVRDFAATVRRNPLHAFEWEARGAIEAQQMLEYTQSLLRAAKSDTPLSELEAAHAFLLRRLRGEATIGSNSTNPMVNLIRQLDLSALVRTLKILEKPE